MPSKYYNPLIRKSHLWELDYRSTGLYIVLYPMLGPNKCQRWYIDHDDLHLSELGKGRIQLQNKTTGMKWKLYTSDSHQFCKYSTAHAFDTISNVMLLS